MASFDAVPTAARLDGGGTLDIDNSVIRVSALGPFERLLARPVVGTDATVTISGSEVRGQIRMERGAVHVLNSSLQELLIDETTGSITGGSITYQRGAGPDAARQGPVIIGTGSLVLDGVSLTDGRVTSETICVDTINEDDPSGPNPVVQDPPLDCQEGTPQAGFPSGPHPVPGSIEAEDYDTSTTDNLSWADADEGNFRSAYRNDDVDIWPTFGEDGFTVGRTEGGEWLEYTIDVSTEDTYDIRVRLATGFAQPGSIRVSVDGTTIGTIDEVPIDGWWNWSTISAGKVDLAAGLHKVRLDIIGNGEINLDRIEISEPSTGPICAGLTQEAEDGLIVGAMQASATAIGTVPGTPSKYGGADGDDYVEYCVTAPRGGQYELDASVLAPTARADSFYIGVNVDDNDDEPVTWHIWPAATEFSDRTVGGVNGAFAFNLVAGNNVVRFYQRETGAELDAFSFRPVPRPCDGLTRNAADGIADGAMTVTSDRIGSVPGTPPKYGSDGFDGNDYVEFCVTAAEAADYQLSALVVAPDTSQDSFFITIGDSSPFTWHVLNTVRPATRFAPTLFALDAGPNVVRVHHREAGTELLNLTFVLVR